MVANAPFGSSTSLLEELKGQDIGMQQLNSGISSLCFSSTMSNGGVQNADVSMSSCAPYFAPRQGESPYHPISPMSPSFRQQDAPSLAWHSLSSDSSSSQGMAPRNNIPSSPVIYSKTSFVPMMNTPVSSGLRSSQFLEGNNQLDPFGSFLPPPPNLERSDSSQHVGRLDHIGEFSSLNHIQPTSPFLSSPKRVVLRNDAASNIIEAAFSSPGNYLRQSSYGPKSSPTAAPSSQILYQNKPSSWNGGNDFSIQRSYREGVASSPSTYDRFNSKPPRHCGTKDTQALLSPRVNLRHAASDGNFNVPFTMPLAAHASPIPDTNQECYQHGHSAGFGASSFDSSVQSGGQLNDRNSFASMDTLNPNVHFQHYRISQSSPIPLDPNSSSMRHDNHFVHRSPATPILNRHNSTGSQHYLVNERGEIVGHASPMISHSLPEGFAPIEQMNNVPQNRQHRANSYGGKFASQLNSILPQHNASLNLNFNPITFHSDSTKEIINSSSMGNHVGSIGDGRMQHQRHKTEPIPFPLFQQQSVGNVEPRNRATTDSYELNPSGVNSEVAENATQDIINIPSFGLGLLEDKASESSYAAKLMAPRPQPTMDQSKGRVSSQPLTADTSTPKSGPRMIYNIKFKRSQRNFILGPRFTRDVKIGCYVKVEADRGEDLGIVMGITPVEKFVASSKRNRSMTEESTASSGGDATVSVHNATAVGDMKKIMRLATNDEISLLDVKREEEEELMKICSTKVRQRGLPMSVVDAEYQFDRNKLTFFFQAEGRIDFRELVRDLFSMYKTRIWMEQIDKNGSVDEPTD